jgi:UDP-glucose 4-epimerase
MVPSFAGCGPVLVAGSGGFVGRHLVSALCHSGAVVQEIVNRTDCDLRDREAVAHRLRTIAPAMVVHLAASPDDGAPACGPLGVHENTVTSTVNLLAELPDDCLFVHVGSYKQYGSAPLPFREDAPMTPTSAYGVAKQMAESLVLERADERFDVVCLRVGPLFGPGQDAGRLVPHIVETLLDGPTGPVAASDTCWDPTYVADCVEAVCQSLVVEEARGRVLNISRGTPCSPAEITRLIAEQLGVDLGAGWRPSSVPGLPMLGDPTLAQEILGWTPRTPLADGLRHTVDHMAAERRRAMVPAGNVDGAVAVDG